MRHLYILLLLVLAGQVNAQNWQQTSGPEGGLVRTVAAADKYVIAGLWNGNLYRMQEDDQKWKPLTPIYGLQSLSAQGKILFAHSSDGLFLSYDFGSTWVPVVRGTFSTAFSPIVKGQDALYFLANDSLYRSSDAGDTWNFSGATGQSASSLGYSNDKLIAAGGFTGVFSSDDRGATWVRAENGLPQNPMFTSMVTVYDNVEKVNTVWLSIQNEGMYYTDDGGERWKKKCDGLPEYNSQYPSFSTVIEANGKLYGSTDQMVYEFDFDSERWKEAAHLAGKRVQAFGGKLYSTSADGVERSSDGGVTWQKVGTNFRFALVNEFAVARKAVVAAAQSGLFRTLDEGATWEKTADFYSEDITAGHAMNYAESLDGVYRSSDDGATWELANDGIEEELYHMSCVDANSTAVFAGFYDIFGFHGTSHWNSGGIVRSTDNGNSWKSVSIGLSNDGFADAPINKIHAYDDVQFALAVDGLYRSTNNGTRWSKVTLGMDMVNDMLLKMIRTGDVIYLSSLRSMFRSTDAGKTWQTFNSGLQPKLENHQAMLMLVDTLILKSYEIFENVYKTYRLDGDTWVPYTMIAPEGVDFLEFFAHGTTLYGGTAEHSVWTRSIPGQASVKHDIASQIGLAAYPNPFIGATSVSFTLPKSSLVHAALYDLTGKLAMDVVNTHLPQGPHTVQIEARDLSAGTYLCRITTNEGVAEAQVVLLQ